MLTNFDHEIDTDNNQGPTSTQLSRKIDNLLLQSEYNIVRLERTKGQTLFILGQGQLTS